MNIPLTLYCHFPWCVQKCPYCDFNSYKYQPKDNFDAYVQALYQDIRHSSQFARNREIQSIFFGGGTPSLFPIKELEKVIQCIRKYFTLAKECEITMEMNPNTHQEHTKPLRLYKDIGINRLSIGAQSFNNKHLQALGRTHSNDHIIKTYNDAVKANYQQINIDIMYALPEQTVKEACDDLKQVLSLHPHHLSWYCLTIEPNTYFSAHPPSTPNDDITYEIMQKGHNLIKEHGYQQYEISAFAKSAKNQCKHNLNYWKYGDYIGIGCGAHSKITTNQETMVITRYEKHKTPKAYLMAPEHQHNKREVIKEDIIFEYMLNKLRLYEPIIEKDMQARTSMTYKDIACEIIEAEKQGLILKSNDIIHKTKKGNDFLNDLQAQFLTV